ncbi:helix-turn-helix domain-containing protein [Flagellimonas sp. CMM7]|uniref:helix-turn-helix domain-containing protein n=1 Tax=Flagellimonas sp. CMM7 TaxID=2654676 RepID=UPI0013D0029F|nr:helix-turn-helix domain-containing protein [Flagellimonas sp. CMM7]UII81332.1 helix-turn-helix domain-containing protein [Flagellimonas sp. CMM7]
MQLNISIIQLITICAVANGFIFGFLLLEKKENRFANRFLFLSLICMCLTFTPYMLDPSIWDTYKWLAWMPFSLSYWIGPSFYFYVRTLTNPSFLFTKRQLWHFSPLVLNYVHSIYHAIFPGSRTPWYWFHFVTELFESAAILSILIYMILSFKLVKKYQRQLLNNVSTITKINLQWVKKTILVIVISFVLISIFLFISSGISGKEFFYQWDEYRSAILLLYSCVLYWLSIRGYQQAQTIKISKPSDSIENLPDKESTKIIDQLHTAMVNQKLFRNPELSLASLSKSISVSERTISEVLNGNLNKNFYQFVNEYRVMDVQGKLKDPKNSHLKILSLAFDAGFNSKATFNRLFKTYTGLTPKGFKSQNLR